MKRVLLMAHQLNLGGTERQLTEIAKALDRARFEPHVGCFHSEGIRADELRAAGVPILRLPVTSFVSASAISCALRLRRYIRDHRIDLVHTFDVPLNVFGVPVARMSRAPVVVSSQRAHRDLTPGLYHGLLRITDRLVDAVVVNCEFMRRHLIDDDHVPERLIHLCYNGIDLEVFRPQAAPRQPEIVIGVVCALRPEKGLPTLLEAFARLHPKHAGLKLVLVGDGPSKPALQAQAAELEILDACTFAPTTNRVADWLRSFDIFVLPSKSEALSNALMEAMACGCCVVASRVGGNPELTGEDERGLLFDAGNSAQLAAALERLIAAPELRADLAAKATNFIHSGFSLAASAQRMGAIYDSLIY
ncbi:MAG: glycosyltransferase family 4 protein [Acidobacteriota bacterium]|nr:glycosyltransferase family 4 protein [Acidobacteriota bacterium]